VSAVVATVGACGYTSLCAMSPCITRSVRDWRRGFSNQLLLALRLPASLQHHASVGEALDGVESAARCFTRNFEPIDVGVRLFRIELREGDRRLVTRPGGSSEG
jgi:hypothetical protein